MRRRVGREMRSLMLAISLMVILLVLVIIAYFLVNAIITTSNNIEHNKEVMMDQSAKMLSELGKNIGNFSTNMEFIKLFNQEIIAKVMKGDVKLLYDLILVFSININPVDYMGIVVDGRLVDYRTPAGEKIDPQKMPVSPPEGDYQSLDALGDRQGFFVSAFFPLDLSILGVEQDVYVNAIVDRTAELAEIEDYFNDQRNDMILRLGIAAAIFVLLSILLTTFGLRYFTTKYVTKPVERLNRMAEEIAEGTYEGEVEVDEKSAFAPLEGLLRSGQKILEIMDKTLYE